MEKHMELSKKTTILFSPELHKRLSGIAAQKGVSLGELVRSACEKQYGAVSKQDRYEAVRKLAALELPVGDVNDMKSESVLRPEEIIR
jgi:hypothetical protein